MKNPRTNYLKLFAFALLISVSIGQTACEKKQELTSQITQKDIQAMKDNHLIKLNDAVKMYHKYDKLRIKFFKDSLKRRYGNNFNDTRNIWFDIASLKAYIKYVEDNASDAEGLAFYFGVKSSNARQGKNHQSFFIAPTVKNGNRQSGFTIKNGKRVFLYEAFKEYSEQTPAQKGSLMNFLRDDDGFLFNFGTGGPPGDNN